LTSASICSIDIGGMSAAAKLSLPDRLAEEAQAAGLLTPEAMRRQHVEELRRWSGATGASVSPRRRSPPVV